MRRRGGQKGRVRGVGAARGAVLRVTIQRGQQQVAAAAVARIEMHRDSGSAWVEGQGRGDGPGEGDSNRLT